MIGARRTRWAVALGGLAAGVLAALGVGSSAGADTATATASVPLTTTESTQTVTLDQLSEPGLLHQVTVTVEAAGATSVEVTNLTSETKATTVSLTATAAATGPGVTDLVAEADASDSQDLAADEGATFDVDGSGEQSIVITDPAVLASYVGTGTVSFDVTGLHEVDVSGPAVWQGTGEAEAAATVTVEYEYTANLPPAATDDDSTVDEDAGATPVDVLANDTDPDGDPLAVQSVTQPAAGTVVITGGGTGISYDPAGQFESLDDGETATEQLTYTVVDEPGSTDTGTVTVSITGVDDAPVAVDDTATVGESSGPTAIDVLANDTDVEGDVLEVASVSAPTSGTVTLAAGEVTFTPDPGYCGPAGFDYAVSDGDGPTDAGHVDVTVTCINDAPVVDPATFTVDEGSADGTVVGTVGFTDPDPGQTHAFAITAGNTGGAFAIDSASGEITVADSAALDFEATPTYGLTVTVTDDGTPPLSGSGTVTVDLTDLNDAPVVDPATFTVGEDSADGTVVGTVSFDDEDAGQTHAFAITAGNTAGAFAIDSASGEITVADSAALDFEATPTYGLTVTVTDDGTPPLSGSAAVTVDVTDVNEAPVVDSATFSAVENSADGTAVGTVSFDDPDTGQTHAFAITAGNMAGAFAIDSASGEITVADGSALDFETTPTYGLTVAVTDDGTPPLSGSATVTIDVTDVNEAPVVDTATFGVAEHSVDGTAVGTVTFDDPDAGQTHTFAIAAGNTGGTFAIDAASGEITVADSAALDFETTPSYSLTVAVTDDGTLPLSGSATITIDVADVNDAPVVDPATFGVAENSVNGTAVGTVTFDDPDAGQAHGLAITAGNTGGAFAIDTASGEVTVADGAALDFESTPSYSLTVAVTDDGTPPLSGSATVTVDLNDVNEAPAVSAPPATAVERDEASPLTGISVADADVGDELTLTLTAGNGTFAVGDVTGGAAVTGEGTDTLVLAGTVDEINTTLDDPEGVTYLNDSGFAGASDNLSLELEDSSGLSDDASVTLLFNQPPVAADLVETTDEDTPLVVTLSATDADDDDLTFAIVDAPGGGTLGSIAAPDCTTIANTCTAEVTYTPDDDVNGVDQFGYEVGDGVNTDAGTVDITVEPVNDTPVAEPDAFSTDEDTPLSVTAPGVLVNDSDADTGTTLSAVLVDGPGDAESFSLDADGSFAYTPADDFNGSDSFTYQADDGGTASNTVVVTLTVDAVADAPTVDASPGSAAFTEGGAPVLVDPGVTVADVDGATLAAAQVQLTGSCQPGEDVLALPSPPAGITVAAYEPATCTLDLTGPAPIASFQTALRAVTYTSTSDDPSTTDRTATLSVDDGALLGSDTRAVTVTAVNDAPVITLSGASPTFTEDGPAVAVDSGLTITDPDDTDLEAGGVTISAGSQSGDVLSVTPGTSGITDTDASPTILTLSGTATIADWQAVLRSVQFTTTNQNPGTSRTIAFTVDDGTASSGTASKTVTVIPVNDPSVLVQPDTASLTYTENAAPTVIVPAITATDVDSADLAGATIDIGTGYVAGQDVLSLGANPQNGISAVFNSANGTLTLTGSASVASYQTALRDVRYANSSDAPTGGPRTITVLVTDGTDASNTVSRTVAVVPVNDAPVAGDDSFIDGNGALANTRLAVGTPTTGPHLATAGSVLANDTDVDTPSGLSTGPVTISSAGCAGCNNVTLNANGSFTYDPPADFTGNDTFTYTVTDNDPETPANQTDTATVTIEVFGPVVWYVDVDAPAPAAQGGRSHSPFASLAPLTTGGAADGLDGDGDVIFLGVDDTAPIAPYDGGIVLEPNQRLLGAPFGLTVDPGGTAAGTPPSTVLVAASGSTDPATNPTVRNSAAAGAGITLANGVEVQRVNAGTSGAASATGIAGTSVTNATIGPNQLIQGNTTGLALSGPGGGTINVGATVTGNSGNAVNISGRNGGTVTFTGPIDGSATNAGATLSGNSGATIAINGALNLAGSGTAGTTFSATGGGTITATNAANQIIGFTGTGINLNGVSTGTGFSLGAITSSGAATNGILLTNVAGPFTASSGAITATSRALDVDDNSGAVTIGATLTTSGAGARSVEVTNRDGGTVDLNGLVTDTSQGVNLTTNGTGLVRFDGGLVASTGANAAFNATGGGSVAVTDANGTAAPDNTLSTTTGTALNVANTTIHADDLTFLSISTNGGPSGVVLNSTGTSGNLAVTGDGDGTPDGGGGTIQSTSSHGIALTNTMSPSLTDLSVTNAGNADNEYGLLLTNVGGTVLLDDMTFNNAADNLVYATSTSSSTINVTGSLFSYPTTISGTANSAMLFEPGGAANLTASVTGSTFTDIVSRSTQIGANTLNASGSLSLTFSGNTVNARTGRSGGVTVSGQELTRTALSITNNTFNGAGGNGVISIDANDTSVVTGAISNNAINNPPGIGIFSAVDEAASSTLTFNGNTVTNAGGDGMQLVNFGGAGTSVMNATVTNNIVNGHSLATAVSFVGGISVTSFEDAMDLQLTGNTVTGTPASATQCGGAPCVDYYLEEVGGTFRLEEVPDTAATAASAAYVNATNDAGPVTLFGLIDLSNGVEISSS